MDDEKPKSDLVSKKLFTASAIAGAVFFICKKMERLE
jgi:hypothetical protein